MNLEFRPPDIQDKSWIDDILKNTYYIKSDAAFGTIYIWSDAFNTKICNFQDSFIVSYDVGQVKYTFPFTQKNPKDIIKLLIFRHKKLSSQTPFIFTGLIDKEIDYLKKEFPNQFEVHPKRGMWEYIYSCDNLSNLPGKKYHNKRTHINNFKKLYSFEYEIIKKENITDCYKFIGQWYELNGNIQNEKDAICKSLDNYQYLDFLGAVIKVNGEIVALTLGEKISSDTFVIHFEKALKSYTGAYSMINCEFSKTLLSLGFKYINREEDLDIPGLRKSKLSYNPLMLIQKYDVVFGSANLMC